MLKDKSIECMRQNNNNFMQNDKGQNKGTRGRQTKKDRFSHNCISH